MPGSRVVHQTDGVAWLRDNPLPASHGIITSLPDNSEIPSLGYAPWRKWFADTVALCLNTVDPNSAALFFQTDVKREGTWVDKSFLCHLGAEAAGAKLLWHKVVCRAPPGTATFGRPAYAHLLAYSKNLRADPGESTPDVIPRLGEMTWARAMGIEACEVACRYFLERTPVRTIVDPFCGLGSVLAVANQLGMDSVGVELSKKRAEKARELALRPLGH